MNSVLRKEGLDPLLTEKFAKRYIGRWRIDKESSQVQEHLTTLSATERLSNTADALRMLLSWASDIISVGWAAYNNVAQINGGVRLHDAEIHTQHIENLWMRAKRKLRRQFGGTRAIFDTYMEEFMWEQRHKEHKQRLAALLVCIRQ